VVGVLSALAAVGGALVALTFARAARRADAGSRVRGLAEGSRLRLPARPRALLTRALADAAIDLEPEGACELVVGAVVAAALLALAIAPGLALPVALGVLAAGPIALRLARHRAEQQFVAALPGGLEHVAAAMRGGAGVADALESLAGGGPLAPDIRRVRSRAALGMGLADALGGWPEERPLPSVRAAAGALAVATTIGGRAADALDVGGAPLAYLAFSAITDPASVELLVTRGPGRLCLAAGLACEALAVLWMRRIVAAGAAE
jgi:Flp pilus assembly protein TadB